MSATKLSAPGLTQRPPRSPRTRLGGFVLLPRMLDKGRATLAGIWSDVPGPFQNNGGLINIALRMTGRQKFYRLTRP